MKAPRERTHENERGYLERTLQKPRETWTVDELARFAVDRKLSILSIMHVGGDGRPRTLDFAPRSQSHWRDVMRDGERADGSSLFDGMESGASDILLRPRPETAFLDPFSPMPTLVLLAGHEGPNGEPLPQSPDTILTRASSLVERDLEVHLWALGEVEYFLGRPVEPRLGEPPAGGYHAASPHVFGEKLRREALVVLSDMGVPCKYGHSEVACISASGPGEWDWEQHEIELALAPLRRAADGVVLSRWVLENLAMKYGYACSLDPIVREGSAGNGLHFHFWPKAGQRHPEPVGSSESLAPPEQWLIAGMVRWGGALMAFGNRTPNSYIRLGQAKEAPNALTWGFYDRQALVRIPVVAAGANQEIPPPRTIEFRLPDGSAHPHLLLAGVAQSLREGSRLPDLEDLLSRTRSRVAHESSQGATSLPLTPGEVAGELRTHREVFEAEEVFPPGVIERALRSLGN